MFSSYERSVVCKLWLEGDDGSQNLSVKLSFLTANVKMAVCFPTLAERKAAQICAIGCRFCRRPTLSHAVDPEQRLQN